MAVSSCPSCDAKVELGPKPKMGQRVKCSFCKTELEVVWLDPVELDWPFDDDDESCDEFESYDEFEEELEDW